jgi:membrane-associated phospholipid phosphatase
MQRGTIQGLSFLVAASLAAPAAASTKSWDTASTVGEGVMIAAALGVPAVQQDWKGDLYAGESIGAAFALSYGLKKAFPEWRPDHSDRQSFPSGHASVSFAAAATLQNRYGWEVGLPAQLLATFVGVARVKARKHHWYDVLAGAAIGESSGFLLTKKRSGGVQVMPWGDTKGAGIAMGMRF